MARDNVTFTFNIDHRQFVVKGKQMGAVLVDLERKSQVQQQV